MQILVFVDNLTPRVSYIVCHILENMLGLKVVFTSNINDFNSFVGAKICYSQSKTNDSIHITPHSLLSLNGIFKQSFAFFKWRSLPAFFQTNPESNVPFDIFSASFYLITRYEEYLTNNADIHGRFIIEESLAFQNGFLHLPLIDLWTKEFGSILKDKYPHLELKRNSFVFLPTIDIDNAYAFLHKGFLRSGLGLVNSLINLRFREFVNRVAVLTGLKNDPYNTFDKLFEVLEVFPHSVWFILGGEYSKYDKNIKLNHPEMRKLLNRIKQSFSVGIHPSYKSNSEADTILIEKQILEKVIEGEVSYSRQHFLRFTLPKTYQTINDIGITTDFTMGYSNAIGFRASTCTSYNFYNLIDEKQLPLKVVPFAVMDRSLLKESKGDPSRAIDLSIGLARQIAEVGGTFVTVWHNESLSGQYEWKGWEDVFRRIVSEVRSME